MADVETGVVKWFNDTKGFGFIQRSNNQDVFVHYTSIVSEANSRKTLTEGQRVEFKVIQGKKGLQAEEVKIVE